MIKLVELQDDENTLIPRVFAGIDVNNIIASGFKTYTATEDCYAFITQNAYQLITIDDITVGQWGGEYISNVFLLKAGQTIKSNNVGANTTVNTIYGIKYN